VPDDDLVGEVLIPAMSAAIDVRVGAGYFSSRCLAQIAPGLSAFVEASQRPIQLLISPEIDDRDRDAIERGAADPQRVVDELAAKMFGEAHDLHSALVDHTLDCLAYLVATARLEFRFVLMTRGMYHKKIWLFRDADRFAAVHGSGNATSRGLLVNGEQMTVDRPWVDGPIVETRVALLNKSWERQWTNKNAYSVTLSALQGLPFVGRATNKHCPPSADDFWEAWRRDHAAGLEPALPPGVVSAPSHLLTIPLGLEWRDGRYRHQSLAVTNFLAANCRGVFQIATGGGKTKTALVAATEIQNRMRSPLVVLILVPSTPLVLQWAAEIALFGIHVCCPSEHSRSERASLLDLIGTGLKVSGHRTEVIVATNSLFTQDQEFREFFRGLPPTIRRMLIADEMHHLGTQGFLGDPPNEFEIRLGLSATPIRQYDPDGTDRLFGFFGQPVIEFGLREAIAAHCLTPYSYHIHEVSLTADEYDRYAELTEKLRRANFGTDDRGQTVNLSVHIERLLRDRRAVLEHAEGKLEMLKSLLLSLGPRSVSRTLIYASAKSPMPWGNRQIDDVNQLLIQLGIIAHQFTSEETSRAGAAELLKRFEGGEYQVLTAMKVLDEGIDLPQVDTAYILASSTVRREWIQRRGRLLRRATGKTSAAIHDFLVVPPDLNSSDGQTILRGELARIEEFSSDAENEWMDNGPRAIVSRYDRAIGQGVIS
jgi:superfamily II DNA or RNA helicase